MKDLSSGPNDQLPIFSKKVNRRNLLKTAGIGGVGVMIGATGIGGLLSLSGTTANKVDAKNTIPFYGKHQAGIVTDTQNHLYFAALEITTDSKEELIELFKEWTVATEKMTNGLNIGEDVTNESIPPHDTGEAVGLSPSNLTLTFGVGPSLFVKNGQSRFGLNGKQPKELVDLPKFSFDALDESWSGGDLCIQACADDLQVAFHAVRNLVRIARGKAVIHWAQTGFQRSKQADSKKETPRNLFGFKDGTIQPEKSEINEHVWVQAGDGPNWLVGGSYMIVRKIHMYIEVWDRTTLKEQENTFGRHRSSGAPLGMKEEFDSADYKSKNEQGQLVIPETAHMRVAHGTGTEQLLRRAYSYTNGIDNKTGSFDTGLLFICFQRFPSKQFIPMQNRLAKNDRLNEYTVHKGSAIFACLPGMKKGGYLGQELFG